MARAFRSHSNAHFSLSIIHDTYKIAVYSQISENSQLQNYQIITDVQDKRQICVVMKLKFQPRDQHQVLKKVITECINIASSKMYT